MKQVLTLFRSIIAAILSIGKIGLWKYYIYSGLISLFLFISIIVGSWSIGKFVGEWIIGSLSFLVKYQELGNWFARIVLLISGLVLYKYILLILISPLMGGLSEKVERYKINHPGAKKFSFTESFARGIKISVRNLALELILTLSLLLLSLIPFFAILTAPVLFLVQAYFMGFGNMDFYMERHKSIKEARNFVRKNWLFSIGNGALFIVLLLIPFFGALIAPSLCATAATLGSLELDND